MEMLLIKPAVISYIEDEPGYAHRFRGVSHAPRRSQAAMFLDAFQTEKLTMLAVDWIFMMPQLGILSTIHAKAAMNVFDRDCLIKLGTASLLGPSVQLKKTAGAAGSRWKLVKVLLKKKYNMVISR